MKNVLDGIHSWLSIVDKNISELEDITIGTSQNEIEIKASLKKKQKTNRSSVSYATISSNLPYVWLELLDEKKEQGE